MGTLANMEDPDEMLHNGALHQGLHCLLRHNQSSEKVIQYFLENITCELSIYTMDYPDFFVCSFMEKSISLKSVKGGFSAYVCDKFQNLTSWPI